MTVEARCLCYLDISLGPSIGGAGVACRDLHAAQKSRENRRQIGRAEHWLGLPVGCVLLALVSGCAGIPRDPSMPVNDPNEQLNRGVLKFNQVVLDPAANVVQTVTPGPVLDRLRDLDSNLKEPRIFVNDILQGRLNAAGITFGRFSTTPPLAWAACSTSRRQAVCRSRPAISARRCSSGASRRALCGTTLFRPRDHARLLWRSRGHRRRSGRLDAWSSSAGRRRSRQPAWTPWCISAHWKRGRGLLDRLLQLPAVELLSDAPRATARGPRTASGHRDLRRPARR